MDRFAEGDQVRIDIPDTTDPDHDQYHGKHGTVTDVLEDHAGNSTGDNRDNIIYRIQFKDGTTMDFRWRDLRPR